MGFRKIKKKLLQGMDHICLYFSKPAGILKIPAGFYLFEFAER